MQRTLGEELGRGKCPFAIRKLTGDEVFDYCTENDMRLCLLEGSNECPVLDELSREGKDDITFVLE